MVIVTQHIRSVRTKDEYIVFWKMKIIKFLGEFCPITSEKSTCEGVPSIKQILPAVQNKFVGAFCERPRANAVRPYGKKDRECEISLSFFSHLACKV